MFTRKKKRNNIMYNISNMFIVSEREKEHRAEDGGVFF